MKRKLQPNRRKYVGRPHTPLSEILARNRVGHRGNPGSMISIFESLKLSPHSWKRLGYFTQGCCSQSHGSGHCQYPGSISLLLCLHTHGCTEWILDWDAHPGGIHKLIWNCKGVHAPMALCVTPYYPRGWKLPAMGREGQATYYPPLNSSIASYYFKTCHVNRTLTK